MPETAPSRLTPDEAEEVLRLSLGKGERMEGSLTTETVAARAGISPEEVTTIVLRLRRMGAAIDLPSGDLGQLRKNAEDLEIVEEDPRALARIADGDDRYEVATGAGRLPKRTQLILILIVAFFLVLLILKETRFSPVP